VFYVWISKKTKQIKSKQIKTKHNKTKQITTHQNKSKQIKTKYNYKNIIIIIYIFLEDEVLRY